MTQRREKVKLWTRATPDQDPAPVRRSAVIRHGIWLGVLADILATVLFWTTSMIPALLSGDTGGGAGFSGEDLALIGALATFLVVLLPAMAGGAIVGAILLKLRDRPRLPAKMALVGAGASIAVISFVPIVLLLVPGASGSVPWSKWMGFFALLLAFALPVGALHGWRMAAWLRRQEQGGA